MKYRLSITFFILLVLATFCFDANKYSTAFLQGLALWARNVLPTMLPFLFLTSILTELDSMDLATLALSPLVVKGFGCSPICSKIYLLSLLCGYPVGAKTASEYYLNGNIDSNSVYKSAVFCSCASPLFVYATVGLQFLNRVPYAILIAHYLSTVICGLIFRKLPFSAQPHLLKKKPSDNIIGEAMYSSVTGILNIGGLIAFFFMLCAMLESLSTALNLPPLLTAVVCAILEMTNGCLKLSQLGLSYTAVSVLVTMTLSFGGLCVFSQTMSYYKKCNVSGVKILLLRLVQSATSGVIALVLTLLF